jgi:ABC-type multidrug transport system fused ATPase/permease subunit
MRAPGEFAFLARLFRPYRKSVLAAIALLALDSALLLTMPWLAGMVANALIHGEVPTDWLLVWLLILSAQAVVSFYNGLLLGSTSARVAADLGSRVYDHLQSLPLSWHQERKRGEVLALLVNDVTQINAFLASVLIPLLPLLITCFGALVMLVRIRPSLGLAIALGTPVLALLVRLLTRELRPLVIAYLHEDSVKHGMAEQNLASLALIKAFTGESRASALYGAQGDKVRGLEVRQLRIESLLKPVVRWLAAASVLLLVWVGSRQVATGDIAPAELISMLLYGMLLAQPVSQLAGVYGQLQLARGSSQRLQAAMAEAPEPDDGQHVLEAVRGDIAFRSVGFGYPGGPPVFSSLDLEIHAGETIAITGRNGAGKSTLAHLLMRFADPSSGSITLDGVDLREYSLRSLRAHIGLVSQHVLLLNASVAENIGYGRAGATREHVEAAARAARVHEFVAHLSAGYDTVIGDSGLRLSGGQRQRISLARALLKGSSILILDEATAMFDPESERGFIEDCHGLFNARTVLLITHRPASLALADRIVCLENGRAETADRKTPA